RPTPWSRASASASRGRPESAAPDASECSRASTCNGEVRSVGTSDSTCTDTRTASAATASPSPARTSSNDDAEPSSTADAWAATSRDSAVWSADVRRRPRSRSSASIPSRAAANADGTPSRPSRGASGSSSGMGTVSRVGSPVMNEEPTVEQVQQWAHSFGGVVDAYDRARPTYPREAAQWLVGQEAATVLELGAGTGKLTAQLVELGHD